MFFLAIASLIMSAVGAGVSYVGSQQAAKAAEDAGRAQQAAADAAARNAELQAAENTSRERVNARRRLARMRAGMAGTSGLVFDGSMQDAFTETAGQFELQIQDAARSAHMDAANKRSQGDMALWESRAQSMAIKTRSYGTLLTDGAALAKTGYSALA
jgi:multidrug efflux pump subunit AcrA (membrane-fusion protein)